MTHRTWVRALILVVGLLLPQAVLYGPSLVGLKILLPLDLLKLPGWYMPVGRGEAEVRPHDIVLSDPVLQLEPMRRYTVQEVRAGRLPLWSPYNYCGSPFLATNQPAVFSPYRVLDYLWDGPGAIAWGQVFKALVAGVGAYLFFRIAMRAGFAAAVIGAWCWPLCGFLTLWAEHPHSAAASWLPWILLATDGVVRRPGSGYGIMLALFTAATLVSGHSGVAAQVMLCSGLYFLGSLPLVYGWRGMFGRRAVAGALVTAAAGWGLGILLAGPQVFPTLDYVSRGYRIAARLEGYVETKPVGWSALPQVLLPYFHGDTRLGYLYFSKSGNRLESAAAGYAGLIMALVWAPFAWQARRRRGLLILWLALGVLGMAQVLDLPILSSILQLRPLNTLRNNRLTLITGFAITASGVAGLDVLRGYARGRQKRLRWSNWFYVPLTACVAMSGWCIFRSVTPPEVLSTTLQNMREAIKAGARISPQIQTLDDLREIASNFSISQFMGGMVCLVAAGIWLMLRHRSASRQAWFVWLVGGLMVAEMTVNAVGVHPQCDPALYYPEIPALAELRTGTPGRVIGLDCLPAMLNVTQGLPDLRGYDASDPARLVELLELFRNPASAAPASYALTQWYVPVITSPLLDMLSVRYAILRGEPPSKGQAKYLSADYWVNENTTALPRVYVPARAEAANDKGERLAHLRSPMFDPRKVVYVETTTPLPAGPCEGTASITRETPGEVTIDVEMKTAGVVVLADLWEPGWHARYNGRDVDILPANHAVRGVVVPAGKATLVFRYEPASFTWGVRAFLLAAAVLFAWGIWLRYSSCLLSPRAKMLAT